MNTIGQGPLSKHHLRRAALHMERKLGQSLLLLSSIACISLPSFGAAASQLFEHRYPLAAGGSFLLENVNGSVQVQGWDRDEVEVRAVKTARNDPGDIEQVKIDVESDPGQVVVRTRYPMGEGVDVAVEYYVRVPNRVLLGEIGTVNGSVLVRGIEGGGEIRSVNGNVEVVGSSGRFSAKTTNGNVHLELSQLREGAPMNLETVNGSVVLALPSNARANLRVVNMNGEFHSDLPVISTAGLPAAHVFRGRLGTGGGEISVRTVNGGVRLLREPSV